LFATEENDGQKVAVGNFFKCPFSVGIQNLFLKNFLFLSYENLWEICYEKRKK
jgi:hypothetical protein